MSELEKAKERLKEALQRVNAKLIEAEQVTSKYSNLEVENNELRASNILLKKEIAGLKSKLRNAEVEREQQSLGKQLDVLEENQLQQEHISQHSKLTLDELKSLVGQKKWG